MFKIKEILINYIPFSKKSIFKSFLQMYALDIIIDIAVKLFQNACNSFGTLKFTRLNNFHFSLHKWNGSIKCKLKIFEKISMFVIYSFSQKQYIYVISHRGSLQKKKAAEICSTQTKFKLPPKSHRNHNKAENRKQIKSL